MEKELSFLWEVTWWEFVLVTCILGGGAAWMTGRAIASSWQSNLKLVFYIVLLGLAVRFIHFSLYGGTLLSAWYYMIDVATLLIIAFAGKRFTRAAQMASQYRFAYEQAGPFQWRKRV